MNVREVLWSKRLAVELVVAVILSLIMILVAARAAA